MTLRTILVMGACALTVAACSGGSSDTGTNPAGGKTPDTNGTTAGSTGTSTTGGTTGSSTGGSTAGGTTGASTTGSSTTGGTSGGTSGGTTGPALPDGGIPTADCSAGCVTLVGNVFRKAGTKATHGGKGGLYFALFDGNPITGASTAKLVTATSIANADLAADDAKVPYTLGPFAVTPKELQLMVFLDDDNNVDPSAPGPAKGDLVSLSIEGGFGGVRVKPATAGTMTLDVALTTALP